MESKQRTGSHDRNVRGTGKDQPTSSPVSGNRQTSTSARYHSRQEDVPGEGGLDEPTAESQRHSRGAKGARGSNH